MRGSHFYASVFLRGDLHFLKYAILGSGSRSNSYIIQGSQFSILVDQGYTPKEFYRRLSTAGFSAHHIRYIFLTHQHADHIRGVPALAYDLNIPVITHKNLKFPGETFQRWDILPERYYCRDDFSFTAFSTSHDSPHSMGFHITMEGTSYTFLTDTGKILPPMYDYAQSSDVLFLESNYSPTMLNEGPYPPYLRARISSTRGHLSNHDAANFLSAAKLQRAKRIYLCHLSEVNNTPEAVAREIGETFALPAHSCICPRDMLMPTEYWPIQSPSLLDYALSS